MSDTGVTMREICALAEKLIGQEMEYQTLRGEWIPVVITDIYICDDPVGIKIEVLTTHDGVIQPMAQKIALHDRAIYHNLREVRRSAI